MRTYSPVPVSSAVKPPPRTTLPSSSTSPTTLKPFSTLRAIVRTASLLSCLGVTEPEATFSACFGAAFMVWHPTKYAELLAEKISQHGSQAWLVNTGWTGGGYGVGERMSLRHTRAILDAIHDGSLEKASSTTDPIFGLEVPTECPNVPAEILIARNTWSDKDAFDEKAKHLASLFVNNFEKFADRASDQIRAAAPTV